MTGLNGDEVEHSATQHQTFSVWSTSDVLLQSWSLHTPHDCDDIPLGTGPLIAAKLARRSASSFPLIPIWLGIYCNRLGGAIVVSLFLSFVYEGSKFYYHIAKILHQKRPNRWQGTMVAHYVSRMWKALAYMIHFLIGYILMLCAMTYNIWILGAICVGAGSGYFIALPLIQHVPHRQGSATGGTPPAEGGNNVEDAGGIETPSTSRGDCTHSVHSVTVHSENKVVDTRM